MINRIKRYTDFNISAQIYNLLKSNFGESAVNLREVEKLVSTVRENKTRAEITREIARTAIESKKARSEVK